MNINKILSHASEVDYTSDYPIEDFTIESLTELAEKAKENKIDLRIKAEHSNFYQGVLVEVQRSWDKVEDRIKENKELRDKPKKVIKTKTSSQACPVCNCNVNGHYCSSCGQKLRY